MCITKQKKKLIKTRPIKYYYKPNLHIDVYTVDIHQDLLD